MFRIRFDEKSDLNATTVLESTGATTSVLVHHVLPHGNPHYHAYIETDIKENTLRQRIKRLGYTASDFSIKKCDPERKHDYVQYLFNHKHGNIATLISINNFDDQLLHKLQIQAQSVADEFANNQTVKRNSKPTIHEFAQEIEASLKKEFTQTNRLGIQEDLEVPFPQMYEYALNTAIKVCHKYNQPFEEHYLKRLVTTALSYTRIGKEGIIAKIMRKEFM